MSGDTGCANRASYEATAGYELDVTSAIAKPSYPLLPTVWIGSSVLGAAIGAFLGDPKRFGADFAFTALFIGLVAGFNKGRITAATVAASGGAAALVYVTAGPPWHVLAGAFAGIAAAFLAAGPEDA